MRLLSVLTAAIGEWAEYLDEAGRSLAAQDLPPDWRLQWVIQEDGPEPMLAQLAHRFPFADYAANERRLGTAATRNRALRRVQGDVVQVLDCDDVLLPGALAGVIEAFATYPEIHWVAGQADNLMPDLSRAAFPPLIPVGPVAAGAFNDYALANDCKRLPFLPNTMAVRTATVRALGGWPATDVAEDTALAVGVTELTPGYLTPDVTWLWRQHERQTSRTEKWQADLPFGRDLVKQRINALRELGLRVPAPVTVSPQPDRLTTESERR